MRVSGFVFVSYSRQDQAYVDRLVEQLRDFGAEVWLDHKIDYGTQWAKVIQERVRTCAVMVVVMTPRSEESVWVQREINEAEKHAKPIMPILVEGEIWMRFNTTQVEIVRAGSLPTNRYLARVVAASQQALPGTAAAALTRETAVASPPERLPPTIVVDAWGRGDFEDLAPAIVAARPGSRLVLRPGVYTGGFTIDKQLGLVGEGSRDDIVIEASDVNVIAWTARIGRIENITLRQLGGDDVKAGISVTAGVLDVVGCDVTSAAGSAVWVVGPGRLNVRGSRLHQCKHTGAFVHTNGRGTFEDNDITGNRGVGIQVDESGDPTVRANRITSNGGSAVFVLENGRGTFEDNDITGNGLSGKLPGIEVRRGGDPTVRANRITSNVGSAVLVDENGRGTFEDNDITGNGFSGIQVRKGGDPSVRANRITDNGEAGVYVYENGRGTFEDNDITGNGKVQNHPGVWMEGGSPLFRGNRFADNGADGIWVFADGGTYDNNAGGQVVRK